MKTAKLDLKKWRLAKGWTQTETSRRLGVPNTTYRQWELGQSPPTDALIAICELYGISVSHLLGQRVESNLELASAIEAIEKSLNHIRKALPFL